MRQSLSEMRQALLVEELDVNKALNAVATALRDVKSVPAQQRRAAIEELTEIYRQCIRDSGEGLRLHQAVITQASVNRLQADLQVREDVRELERQAEYGMAKLAIVSRILEDGARYVTAASNTYSSQKLSMIVEVMIDQIMALAH